MPKWEYKHVAVYLGELELNKLGQEGWELVSHSIVNRNGTFNSGTISHYYTFKRQIIE